MGLRVEESRGIGKLAGEREGMQKSRPESEEEAAIEKGANVGKVANK